MNKISERVPFSIEVYASNFKSDMIDVTQLDSAMTGDEIRGVFDQEVEKKVAFMTWRWDVVKRRMVPIVDSMRIAKIALDHGRRIYMKDYDLTATVIEVYTPSISEGRDYYNGNVIATGTQINFHWSEIAGWGCVYNLIPQDGDEISYQATKNYAVPDEMSPTFRLCDPKRDGYDNVADLMKKGYGVDGVPAVPGAVPVQYPA